MMSESGIGTSEFSAAQPSTEELTKSKLEMSESLRKQEEEGKNLYDYLTGLQTYVDRLRILEETRMLFTKQENKDNFIQYLNISFNINLSKFPFTTIKSLYPDFYNEIQQLKNQKTGKGNVKFLTSDPQELAKSFKS